jgi:hypothetical protein
MVPILLKLSKPLFVEEAHCVPNESYYIELEIKTVV